MILNNSKHRGDPGRKPADDPSGETKGARSYLPTLVISVSATMDFMNKVRMITIGML